MSEIIFFFRERSLKEQQELSRKVKERRETERQRVEQEKRKEQEEETALEQVQQYLGIFLELAQVKELLPRRLETGVYIFLFAPSPPPGGGQTYELSGKEKG